MVYATSKAIFASSFVTASGNSKMGIIYRGFILLSLVSIMKARNPSTNSNPECNGMNKAAKHLKTGIQTLLQRTAECGPNKHCTGVICKWSGNAILEVALHYCSKPVYHLYFHDPDVHATRNLTLMEGDRKPLYKSYIGTAEIKVTKLQRSENTVKTSVSLLLCPSLIQKCHATPVISDQTICVRMDTCPGFNATYQHYKPCKDNPTDPSTTDPSTSPTSLDPSTTDPSTSPTSLDVPREVTVDPPTKGRVSPHRRDDKVKDDPPKRLSTGAIIGICAAAVVVILVVLGATVYWKKYHHRSRLRAAYYNDISMHDPLYEDFGPEVA